MAAQKPSGSLKKYLDTKRSETRLVGPVERHLLTRPRDNSRRLDVLHPSELIKADFCQRSAYFVVSTGQKKEDRPGLRLQSIFDEGHAIHHKWQNWIGEGGWLYGMWSCTWCGHTFWDTSPSSCLSCDKESFLIYREVPLHDDEMMISGHADGWVRGLGDDFLIEIKSIGTGTIRMEAPSLLQDTDLAGAWKQVRRPFPSHLRQGRLYLELARRMQEAGIFDTAPSEIVFIYELKMDQSYKEFVVQADPGHVAPALERAALIADAVRNETGPPECNINPLRGCSACRAYEKRAS